MADIKPEIKLDPADSPSKLADIDEFEEDTDLMLPSLDAQSKGAWLVKVSEDLWKAWNDMYQNSREDDMVEVGKLRVYCPQPGEQTQRIQVRLNDFFHQHKLLPKVYNLDMRANGYNNTVVFSEKDLPGHRAHQFGSGRSFGASKPTGIQKSDRYGPKKPGSYRTAIPKQTALAPPILNEAVAKPVEDDSSLDFFKRQYDAALNAGKKTTFTNKIDKGSRPGMSNSGFTFGSITSKPGKGKKKQSKEKAVRMSKEQLLDELQKCFTEYQYWPLKALKNRLNQPEAYLKEVLVDIAYPMRSGDFAGNYKLNETSARLLNLQNAQFKEEAAPVKEESDQDTGDELGERDDEDLEEDFEDVKME